MAGLQQLDIKLTGIGKTLADGGLAVPTYQRFYAWEEQNAVELFQDIGTAVTDKEPEYFLGTVVLIKGQGGTPFEVVDGQQRLATITALLAAIRDYFITVNDKERADDLEREYLVQRNLRTQERIPKLRLNEGDHDFFQKTVIARPGEPSRNTQAVRPSHKRISAAAEAAAEHVKSLAKVHNDPTNYLLDWVEYIATYVRIITVQVPDESNAFTIFETLNDRGLDLAISDLLKNYLFHRADDRLDEVRERWVTMLGILEAVEDEGIVVTYVRHLWSSKYGSTREKVLYDSIKASITSKQAAIDLANLLASSALLYAAILNPNHEFWTKYGATTKTHMATLNLLGMVQLRPLLLAILDLFTEAETRKALKVLVSWAVRFLISGGIGGGTLETHYSQRAKEIRDGQIKNTKALIAAMGSIVPADRQFTDAFGIATVSKAHLARYYLLALERQAAGETNPELVPNPNEEEVNLEHVLPLTTSSQWASFPQDLVKTYVRRLGNLALVQQDVNVELGNAAFARKRTALAASKFRLTKMIGKQTQWTPTAIEKRQVALAQLAEKTWPNKA